MTLPQACLPAGLYQNACKVHPSLESPTSYSTKRCRKRVTAVHEMRTRVHSVWVWYSTTPMAPAVLVQRGPGTLEQHMAQKSYKSTLFRTI